MKHVLALLSVFLALPIWASSWTGNVNIHSGQTSSFSFAAADGVSDANDSASFNVKSPYALICFDPDTAGTAGTGGVTPRRCLNNTKPASSPQNECISLGALDGTEGAAATQNACVRVSNGVHYLDITTVCGGNNCRATVTGEY